MKHKNQLLIIMFLRPTRIDTGRGDIREKQESMD